MIYQDWQGISQYKGHYTEIMYGEHETEGYAQLTSSSISLPKSLDLDCNQSLNDLDWYCTHKFPKVDFNLTNILIFVRMLDMKRQIKDALYEQFSRTTKALSSPKRIEILDLLGQSEKTVEMVAEQADLGIKNASAQLKELKSALLVDTRRDGKYIFYRLASENVAALLLNLRTFNEGHFAEIQKIAHEAFGDATSMNAINRKQLLAKAKKGDIILLDVRPTDEYEHSHLPYAISSPISVLQKELKNLPKDKEIVAYCRGPHCFFAKEAVELLTRKGFKASRLKDSVFEWASLGLPVETAPRV